MENVQDLEFDFTEKLNEIEHKIKEKFPRKEIIEIFGERTFLIGGIVRDIILNKNVERSDLDIMTRITLRSAIMNLEALGYTKNSEQQFSEMKYFVNGEKQIINLILKGRECQVGFIGELGVEDLIQHGDVTLNCCAYDLGTGKILNPDFVKEIMSKKLLFCNIENAKNDPLKIISALKQISRIPDLDIPAETLATIAECMPDVVDYFVRSPKKVYKLQSLFGNINSRIVYEIFNSSGGKDLVNKYFESNIIPVVGEKYTVCDVAEINDDLKQRIVLFMKLQYGKRLDPEKIFGSKVKSVAYHLDENDNLLAVCLMDRNRIYAVSAVGPKNIVDLVRDLCESNYCMWATISYNNRYIIELTQQAGLRLVESAKIAENILLANYPEYKNKIVFNVFNGLLTYSKIGSKDLPQVLCIS